MTAPWYKVGQENGEFYIGWYVGPNQCVKIEFGGYKSRDEAEYYADQATRFQRPSVLLYWRYELNVIESSQIEILFYDSRGNLFFVEELDDTSIEEARKIAETKSEYVKIKDYRSANKISENDRTLGRADEDTIDERQMVNGRLIDIDAIHVEGSQLEANGEGTFVQQTDPWDDDVADQRWASGGTTRMLPAPSNYPVIPIKTFEEKWRDGIKAFLPDVTETHNE